MKIQTYSTIAAILIVVTGIWFTSCSDDIKIPEQDPLSSIMGKWYNTITDGHIDTRYYIELKADGTYSYVSENETINGFYKITEIKEKTLILFNIFTGEDADTGVDATLFKMMASGSNDFDQLWVYIHNNKSSLAVHLYLGNERVQRLQPFMRNSDDFF